MCLAWEIVNLLFWEHANTRPRASSDIKAKEGTTGLGPGAKPCGSLPLWIILKISVNGRLLVPGRDSFAAMESSRRRSYDWDQTEVVDMDEYDTLRVSPTTCVLPFRESNINTKPFAKYFAVAWNAPVLGEMKGSLAASLISWMQWCLLKEKET